MLHILLFLQLPRLGLRYTLVSGLLLVGGAYVLMGLVDVFSPTCIVQ